MAKQKENKSKREISISVAGVWLLSEDNREDIKKSIFEQNASVLPSTYKK